MSVGLEARLPFVDLGGWCCVAGAGSGAWEGALLTQPGFTPGIDRSSPQDRVRATDGTVAGRPPDTSTWGRCEDSASDLATQTDARPLEADRLGCLVASAGRRGSDDRGCEVRTAIVTQHYSASGGVPAIARWLRRAHAWATTCRYTTWRRAVATSAAGAHSPLDLGGVNQARGSAAPTLISSFIGANWVEFESRRYRPGVN